MNGIASGAFAGAAQHALRGWKPHPQGSAWHTSADRSLGSSVTLSCQPEPSVPPLFLAVHGLRVIVSQVVLVFPVKDG